MFFDDALDEGGCKKLSYDADIKPWIGDNVAMVPRLWQRTMRPLLADWDRLASDGERALIRERCWDGVV